MLKLYHMRLRVNHTQRNLAAPLTNTEKQHQMNTSA